MTQNRAGILEEEKESWMRIGRSVGRCFVLLGVALLTSAGTDRAGSAWRLLHEVEVLAADGMEAASLAPPEARQQRGTWRGSFALLAWSQDPTARTGSWYR